MENSTFFPIALRDKERNKQIQFAFHYPWESLEKSSPLFIHFNIIAQNKNLQEIFVETKERRKFSLLEKPLKAKIEMSENERNFVFW